MINDLNKVLHKLFKERATLLKSGAPPSVTDQQIRFQPPDPDWGTHVAGLGTRKAVNVYLVDLRENRQLRSNEREQRFENGFWQEDPAPDRVDCHYLITAWSPANDLEDRTRAEHKLLYETIAVLMRSSPLNPARILNPVELATIDPLIQEMDLPTQILPADGFPKLAEFWGAMGTGYRWKPGIYLIVTLPVAQRTRLAGPMVTTKITEYRLAGSAAKGEVWIQIGGHVLDARGAKSVVIAGAWVELATLGDERLRTTDTDDDGRFAFADLQPGRYRLRARATGFGQTLPRDVDVPSPTGEYDLRFT